MRRLVFGSLLLLVAIGGIPGAAAQPKDPFRPPGTGSGEGSLPSDGEPDAPPADRAPGDGLARTGQDVGSPFAAGLSLITFGMAIRLLSAARRGAGTRPDGSGSRRPPVA